MDHGIFLNYIFALDHLIFYFEFRNCIGERFGYMQTKLGIVTIIKNFELSFHENTRYPLILDPSNVVVAPLKKIKLHAKRIQV